MPYNPDSYPRIYDTLQKVRNQRKKKDDLLLTIIIWCEILTVIELLVLAILLRWTYLVAAVVQVGIFLFATNFFKRNMFTYILSCFLFYIIPIYIFCTLQIDEISLITAGLLAFVLPTVLVICRLLDSESYLYHMEKLW